MFWDGQTSVVVTAIVLARLAPINFLLIYGGGRALSDRGHLPVATGLFFAYLTTLIVVLYDTYRPLREERSGMSSGW